MKLIESKVKEVFRTLLSIVNRGSGISSKKIRENVDASRRGFGVGV